MKTVRDQSRFVPMLRQLLAAGLMLLAGGGHAGIIDFEDLTPGATVDVLHGVTFTSNTGYPLIASNVFDAASGDNYLGVDDGGLEVFQPFFGDVVTLSFATAITSLSVSFVSTPDAPIGIYSIVTALGSAVSAAVAGDVLGDGGEVFVVTFTSSTSFDEAELSGGFGDYAHSFSIDDIVFGATQAVAAPPTAGLLVLALVLAGAVRSRHA